VANRLQAVLFDYGHTLIHFDERPHEKLEAAYHQINRLLRETLEKEVPEAKVLIREVSMAVDAEIQRDYESGREEEVEIGSIYEQRLRSLGLTPDAEVIEQVMEMEQSGWIGSVHVGPEVVQTLEQLKRAGMRMGIVSNAAYLPRLMKDQLKALGLADYFDGVSFSSEVGFRKPNRKIYQDALQKVGVDASASLFVGDRLKEDVRGPKSLGMRAVLIREWRQEEDPDGVADYTIERIGDLWPIVNELRSGASLPATYNEGRVG
jgi:putative hydrolase of the HAD superfamily